MRWLSGARRPEEGKHAARGESGIIRTLEKVWQKSFPYNGPIHVGLRSGNKRSVAHWSTDLDIHGRTVECSRYAAGDV